MRDPGPYNSDPAVRRADPSLPWQNERAELNQLGSIWPAEFGNDVGAELRTVILASGQDMESNTTTTPANNQLLTAIQRLERLTENATINVPGDYDTMQDALEYLSTVRIDNRTLITIRAHGGTDHVVNTETGPWLVDHPFGARIEIVGDNLVGAGFPTALELDNANKPTVEALIRTRFPTILRVVGPVPAIFQKGGTLRRLANIAIIGDFTSGQDGVAIGEFQGAIGFGNIKCDKVIAHNLGNAGFNCRYNGAIAGQDVAAVHCGGAGFLCVNMSGMQFGGVIHAVRNGVGGIVVRDNAFFEGLSGAAVKALRNGTGVIAQEGGNAKFQDAASVEMSNNTSFGSLFAKGLGSFPASTTATGNGGVAIQADVGSTVSIPSAAGVSTSPAANTIGNNNSYVRVS